MITGIRQAEGGIRAATYKSCFSAVSEGCDKYRPIFWYTDEDERRYIEIFDVVNSTCYTTYGMKRTGCVGCPFNKDLERDLESIQKYEPKLLVAVNNVFRDSYEYTRLYKDFCNAMDLKYGSYAQYLRGK